MNYLFLIVTLFISISLGTSCKKVCETCIVTTIEREKGSGDIVKIETKEVANCLSRYEDGQREEYDWDRGGKSIEVTEDYSCPADN